MGRACWKNKLYDWNIEMNVAVTGAHGFIGKNLCTHLKEKGVNTFLVVRDTSEERLREILGKVDMVYHLAGVNRPKEDVEFVTGNVGSLQNVVNLLVELKRSIPVVLSSSIHAGSCSPYGQSKLEAEELVFEYGAKQGAPVYVYRLPNVFGKWCRPNYNSVVATFCHNIANDIPISIHDESISVPLVYIDDVCAEFVALSERQEESGYKKVATEYSITLGELATLLLGFKRSRDTKLIEEVGTGLKRALYATYLSYITPEDFAYTLPSHRDPRGVFCEMLKTKESGQFSFFTAKTGITRGGHYHHTKNEKFLVINGKAKFCFQHIVSGERYELVTTRDDFKVVETVPGWTHNVTSIGDDELIVMLWANEIFDDNNPDTFARVIE